MNYILMKIQMGRFRRYVKFLI